MAFLRAHLIFIGLLAYVVAVLNAAGDNHYEVTHPPNRHTYRITSAPHVHRHTNKIPGQRIKHVHRHQHKSPGVIELTEFDNSGASYNADSSNQDYGDYGSISNSGDAGSIPSIPTPAPATPAPEAPGPATPASATPDPEAPAPETPAPASPDPETPAPATLAPETPAPATPTAASPDPDDSPVSSGAIDPSDAALAKPTPAPATPAPASPEKSTPAPDDILRSGSQESAEAIPAPATPATASPDPEESIEGSCPLPAPVEGFSASLYTAYVVALDPKILDQELDGGEAGLLLYNVLKEVLGEFDVCNAEMIAFSAFRGPANVKKISLIDLVKKASVAFGKVLYDNGVLSCNNDVSLALNQFRNGRKALEGRDPSTFKNNLYGLVKGTVDLYLSLGLDLEDVAQQTSDGFSQNYADGDDNCKAKAG